MKVASQTAVIASNLKRKQDFENTEKTYLIPSLYQPVWESSCSIHPPFLLSCQPLRYSVRCWVWALKRNQALNELIWAARRMNGEILASSCFAVCWLIHLVIYHLLLVEANQSSSPLLPHEEQWEKPPL